MQYNELPNEEEQYEAFEDVNVIHLEQVQPSNTTKVEISNVNKHLSTSCGKRYYVSLTQGHWKYV